MARAYVSAAEAVLIAHQRHHGGCLCGLVGLGKSFAGHQVDMLRNAGLLSEAAAEIVLYED